MPLHRSLKAVLSFCLSLLVLQTLTTATAGQFPIAKPGCPDKCGNVSVPYPFGLKEGCSLNSSTGFFLNCSHNETLFFSPNSASYGFDPFRVGKISLDGDLYVDTPILTACKNETKNKTLITSPEFPFSTSNKFIAVGCDTIGFVVHSAHLFGCLTFCTNETNFSQVSSCSGIGCCQPSNFSSGLWNYTFEVTSIMNHTLSGGIEYPCSSVFLAGDSYMFKESDLKNDLENRDDITAIIDWAVGNESCSEAKSKGRYACKGKHSHCEDAQNPTGYRCRCSRGFKGNPYLEDGCQDICETTLCEDKVIKYTVICAAISITLLLVGSYRLYRCIRKRKVNKRKEMLFRQNGGHLLHDNSETFKGVINSIKIFTAEEMEKATHSFNDMNIIGRGGFSIVYKGYLPELGSLAIKKPKTMDQTQIDQFINEVVLLSKIHHQNVVTFLGCCLEMDVPILVYEFVANGTLHHHLHDETKQCIMKWGTRLKIAAETAGVLAYLHNNHRPPVIHRDVKPANILLDGNYNTKVADFGSSRLVPQNETQMHTMVQGTLGYLDPEYLHSSELTEKSDVYSFGVVLVELLTREKVVSFERGERSLVKNFEFAMKDNSVYGMIDQDIVNEENVREIMEVAEVANMCLRVKGEERPTMDEVAAQLKGLWVEVKHKWSADGSYNLEENEHLITRGSPDTHADGLTSNASMFGSNNTGTRLFSWRLSKGR